LQESIDELYITCNDTFRDALYKPIYFSQITISGKKRGRSQYDEKLIRYSPALLKTSIKVNEMDQQIVSCKVNIDGNPTSLTSGQGLDQLF